MSLTKSLRWEIQALGQRLSAAASAEEAIQRKSKASEKAQHDRELKLIIQAIRRLLTRIEDAVPLINLAITASGASLSSSLPSSVSPSRLLQASTFLTAGDSQYGVSNLDHVQIGPTFTLSVYMLFMGHARPQNEEDVRESTWKEVIHKADVSLMRVPTSALYKLPGTTLSIDVDDTCNSQTNGNGYFPQMDSEVRADEYAYQLVIVEDLDDDRVHTFDDDEPQPGRYGDVETAGIREAVPIHELSKIFYADTGKILNIGNDNEANSPVLLLKRDPNAVPPRRMMGHNEDEDIEGQNVDYSSTHPYDHKDTSHYDDGFETTAPSEREQRSSSVDPASIHGQQLIQASDPWRFPPDLDPEWIAFEVYTESEDSDTESEPDASNRPSRSSRTPSMDPQTLSALSQLSINTPSTSSPAIQNTPPQNSPNPRPTLPPIRTSLSLLETLLRLLSLQQFQQTPHLSIPDELLTFFLSESASTGAASNDVQERKRLREEARRRVGFDPYDESPVKRRGEEYQYRNPEASPSQWNDSNGDKQTYDDERYTSPLRYSSPSYQDSGYNTYRTQPRAAPSTPKNPTPQTPPLLLTNRLTSGTPERDSDSPTRRYAPPRRWTDGKSGLRQGVAEAARRGSPLARPGTGITDEGLGTSPASAGAQEGKG